MRNSQWTAGAADAGVRLDKFLAAADRLGSRPRAAGAIERGKVFVNNTEVDAAAAGKPLAAGDHVRVWMDRPGTAKRRLALGDARDVPIVYEDAALLVLNKPAGLLAVPLDRRGDERSAYDDVKAHLNRPGHRRAFVVHRIDRDTSGLVVFAKRADVQHRLKAQFTHREPERVYRAVVYGHPDPPSGIWRDRLLWDPRTLIQKTTHSHDPRGKEAICTYRVLETFPRASLIEVKLATGKQNQIRLQARVHGHMLVGERRYVSDVAPRHPIPFARQALHAFRLSFRHPFDDRPMQFEAPLADDLVALIDSLRRG